MILIVLLSLFVASILLAWSANWWLMLLGAIVMTIGSAVPIDLGSDATTNAFELFLMIMLMKTAIHFSKKSISNPTFNIKKNRKPEL